MTGSNGTPGQLPAPCEVCGFGAWPEGGMHAARSIHMRGHERKGEKPGLSPDSALMPDRSPRPPAVWHEAGGRSRPPVSWPQVVLLAVLVVGLVAVAWACAWGVRG